ncbi:MAG: class I SAM-dependent methyltransferase [Deltaproteobacteria bacterium]|nr:class I SAM-dependent methyltransferase [Deltaproteobacteria bacterium]
MSHPQINDTDHAIPTDISTEIFISNWMIYRKIIENNNMSHREGYDKLRDILIKEMRRPFSFVDLACGDAYYSSKVLQQTRATEYIGIDVSEQALTLARKEFAGTDIEARFERADFINFERITPAPVDVIWIGFSLHHLDTPDKLQFMHKAKKALSSDGILIIYEPILLEGEDRSMYFKRFKQTFDTHWRGLTKEEGESLLEHVRESEKPETAKGWIKLGKDAGFSVAEEVFSEKTGLYELFKFK